MIDRKVIIMKCNNCGCDNPDDAKYCRVCGNVLQLESFFEKLSELGFMPTTMITLKGSLGATLLLYLLELLFIIGCLMVIAGIVNFFVRRDSGFVLSLLMSLLNANSLINHFPTDTSRVDFLKKRITYNWIL